MRMLLVSGLVAVGIGVVAFGVAPAPYVFGPLLGLAIWKVGSAMFLTLRSQPAHVPGDSAPQPLDVERERVVYHCEGCGAEMVLLVRGTPLPPRHCGERMTEHHEVARHDLN